MLPAIVGHRGARGEAPENTLSSFARAIQAGAREIELDVRLSADDQLFVLHDAELKRTTGSSGAAQRLPLAALQALDARHALPNWPQACPIPALQEVLAAVPADTRFQFEVKADGRAPLPALARALTDMIHHQQLANRVVVTSSSARFLAIMHSQAANIPRGYVCQYRHRKPIQTCTKLACHWLIAHHSLINTTLVGQAARHGIAISAWTVNDLKEAERLAALGIASIITDYPTALMAHFTNRQARL